MRMTHRLTSLLLALMLLLTIMPFAAFAEEGLTESEDVFSDVFSEEPVFIPEETNDPIESWDVPEADSIPESDPETEDSFIPVVSDEPAAEVTEIPSDVTEQEPADEPEVIVTEAPADEPEVIVTEAPTAAPTAEPTAVPVEEKSVFVAGLARLSSGARLYEHQGLWGAYVETQASGVVYAADQSDDETAIRVVLNNGSALYEGWVKTEMVSMFTDDQTAAHDAKAYDENLIRTYRGHSLLPITTISSTPTATPEIAVDNILPGDIPLIGDEEFILTEDEEDRTPDADTEEHPEADAESAGEEDVFEESFTEYVPEPTVKIEPDVTAAPLPSDEIGSFVEYRALEAPTNLFAEHDTYGLMTLSWRFDSEADAYRVFRKDPGASEYEFVATVTDHTYDTRDLDPSQVYYFRVQSIQYDSKGGILNASPMSDSFPYIVLGDAVIDDPRGKDPSTIRLTWKAVPGANRYDVMMSVHGKNEWSIVRTDLTGSLCDISNISFDETYDFRVIPKRVLSNGTVITGNASRRLMVGSPMETPSFQQYDWTSSGLKLTWDEIPGATGYVIYRRAFSETNVNNYQKLVVLDEPVTTYIDTTMKQGEVYYYFVYSFKTCEPEGWRCFSLKGDIGMGVWLGTAVNATLEDLQDQGVRMSWPTVAGASHYDVYIGTTQGKLPAGNGNGRVSRPSGFHSTAVLGRTYYYRIRPVRVFSNGDVSMGPWSNEFAHTYAEATPTYRALLIGNTYPNETNYLPGCDNDARSVASMLRRMTGTPYTISVKTNLSDSGMINAIRAAFADAKSNDVSLFYFSGHGANTGSGAFHGALVGLYHTYLSVSRLKEELDAIPGKKIIILDSCHSGAMIGKSVGGEVDNSIATAEAAAFNNAVISAFSSGSDNYVRSTMPDDDVIVEIFTENEPMIMPRGENDLANSGYYVITAAHSTEKSVSSGYDPDGDKKPDKYFGLFTYGVCYGSGWNSASDKALSAMPADLDKNGDITLYEAYVYARAAAKQHNPNQNAQIYPTNSAMVIWGK